MVHRQSVSPSYRFYSARSASIGEIELDRNAGISAAINAETLSARSAQTAQFPPPLVIFEFSLDFIAAIGLRRSWTIDAISDNEPI
jgi:hypothetical protein